MRWTSTSATSTASPCSRSTRSSGSRASFATIDPERQIRLISYAVWWIRAYIQGHVLKSWSLVKIGTTQAQRKLFFSLARTRREIERLSPGTHVEVELVAKQLRVKSSGWSRCRIGWRGGTARIMGDERTTPRDLGTHFGFSRERARQLEMRGLAKLRHEPRPLAGLGWPDSLGAARISRLLRPC